jgi:hypothetical protein
MTGQRLRPVESLDHRDEFLRQPGVHFRHHPRGYLRGKSEK